MSRHKHGAQPVKFYWSWSPTDFDPPFTIYWHQRLHSPDIMGSDIPTFSILARAPHISGQKRRWIVVSAYSVPHGQRLTTARTMKALCEMKRADHINQLEQENQS